MTEVAPFSWLESAGWLVLSGRSDALSEIRAQALSRCDASGAIAYVSLAPDCGDALMDDLAELGAASGYLVDLEDSDNNEVYERLSSAAMIVVEAPDPGEHLLRLLRRTAVHALKDAMNRGALVLLEGQAAATAGEYAIDCAGQVGAGLGLVRGAAIAAEADGFAEDGRQPIARFHMPETTFIRLAPGAALALGPGGAIETWGHGRVSISLGNLAQTAVTPDRDWAIE